MPGFHPLPIRVLANACMSASVVILNAIAIASPMPGALLAPAAEVNTFAPVAGLSAGIAARPPPAGRLPVPPPPRRVSRPPEG